MFKIFVNAWDQFRYRYVDKYHLINTNLGYGWRDADQKLLWCSFSILESVILKEKYFSWWDNLEVVPSKLPEYMGDSEFENAESIAERNRTHQEILDLYNWWVEYKEWYKTSDETFRYFGIKWEDIYSKVDLSIDALGTHVNDDVSFVVEGKSMKWWEISTLAEQRLHDEEDAMLIRLIKVRHYLWT